MAEDEWRSRIEKCMSRATKGHSYAMGDGGETSEASKVFLAFLQDF